MHSDTHAFIVTGRQSTHLCFLPTATPVNNTENRSRSGGIKERKDGEIEGIYFLEFLKELWWHLYIESEKDLCNLMVRLNVKKEVS